MKPIITTKRNSHAIYARRPSLTVMHTITANGSTVSAGHYRAGSDPGIKSYPYMAMPYPMQSIPISRQALAMLLRDARRHARTV
jgi:hypothetical protein